MKTVDDQLFVGNFAAQGLHILHAHLHLLLQLLLTLSVGLLLLLQLTLTLLQLLPLCRLPLPCVATLSRCGQAQAQQDDQYNRLPHSQFSNLKSKRHNSPQDLVDIHLCVSAAYTSACLPVAVVVEAAELHAQLDFLLRGRQQHLHIAGEGL